MAIDTACWLCKVKFRDGDKIVPVLSYATNPKRGDFATTQATEHVHASHLKPLYPARYECNTDSCGYKTDNRYAIKDHAAFRGHFGWTDREHPQKENH